MQVVVRSLTTTLTSGLGHVGNNAERVRTGVSRWQCCGNGTFAITANQPGAAGFAMD